MKKRILGLALAAAMAVSMLPTAVTAVATEPSGDGWQWVADANGQSWGVTLENIEAAGTAPAIPHDIGGKIGENISWVLDTTGTLTISGAGEWENIYPMPWNDYKIAIQAVVFEEGVTDIGCKHGNDMGATPVTEGAFYNCTNLTSITIPNSVKMIDHYSFYRCPINSVTIPKNVEFIGENAFGGYTGFESIIVDAENEYFASVDGVLFNKQQTELIKYPTGKKGDSYVIPDGVITVTGTAFRYCTYLKDITVCASVKEIKFPQFFLANEGGTFDSDQLEKVTILSSDVALSHYLFGGEYWILFNSKDLTVYGYKNSTTDEYISFMTKTNWSNMKNPPVFIPIESGTSLYNFTDVTTTDTYHDAVKFAVDNGLFNGTSETTFSPDAPMTRAMFVTVLGRYAKADTAAYVTPTFTDSLAGQWYTSYVEWAAANNVVSGYGDGIFGINDSVTVEQACVILARFADYKDASGKSENEADKYALSSVSDWASDSVKWAINNGIYADTSNQITPQASASRALVAKMMHAFSLAYAG